jgi:hypothetical protein
MISPLRRRASTFVPVLALTVHTAAVIALVIFVASARNVSEAMMFWLVFMAIDFPISVAVFILIYVLAGAIPPQWISEQMVNVIYALLFGIFGGGQYYWIGKKIGGWVVKRSSSVCKANIDPTSDITDT